MICIDIVDRYIIYKIPRPGRRVDDDTSDFSRFSIQKSQADTSAVTSALYSSTVNTSFSSAYIHDMLHTTLRRYSYKYIINTIQYKTYVVTVIERCR